jgi:hypothetical protein
MTTTIPAIDPVDTLTVQALGELRLQMGVFAGAGPDLQGQMVAYMLNRVLELVNAVRTEDARWFHQREMELLRLLHREQLDAQYARSQAALDARDARVEGIRERDAVVLWLRDLAVRYRSEGLSAEEYWLFEAAQAIVAGRHRVRE